MTKKVIIALLGALACGAQQNTLGQIAGTVKGDDGSAVDGAAVYLKRTTSGQPSRQQSEWVTTATTDGAFQFGPVPSGQYTLCAQAASGNWLNPCEWTNSPTAVIVAAAPQGPASTTIVMTRGAVVFIRVNDPGQFLPKYDGKAPGAHLLVGVRSNALGFRTASVASQDSGGTNYQVTIPFGETVNLVVASQFFSLANATGQALSSSGGNAVQLLIPSGQVPPAITFTVTGGGK